jgi:hypothetical protein
MKIEDIDSVYNIECQSFASPYDKGRDLKIKLFLPIIRILLFLSKKESIINLRGYCIG